MITSDQHFLSDPSLWRFHRLSALPPSKLIQADETPVLPADLGLNVTRAGRPKPWRFALPPVITKDPRHPDFRRFSPASLVLPDDNAVEDALDAAAEFIAYLTQLPESRFSTSELDPARKFTIQRGVYAPWYVQRLSGGNLTSPIPPIVHRIARHVALIYRHHLPNVIPASKPDPSTTNGGWPTFVAHPLAKIAGALLTDETFDITFDNAQQAASGLSIDVATTLGNGLSGRSGPLYKEASLHRFTGTGWATIGTWRGYAQRNRIVHMSSAAVNQGLRRLFDTWHEARKHIPGLWHAGVADRALIRDQGLTFESDISGFDVSVTRELQNMIAWHFSEVFPHLSDDLRFWLRAETLPMIAPSWDRTPDACTVMSFVGGTRSGLKTTAEAGTIYSVIAALYALSRQGFDIWRWPYLTDVRLLVQGDDVLLATNKEVNVEDWTEAYARLGLRSTLIEGDRFLSRHHSTDGTVVPSAARIIQQTLSNEHEPLGDPDVTEGILIRGFIDRTEGCEGLPGPVSYAAAKALRHARWMENFLTSSQMVSIATMRNGLMHSNAAQAAIRRALAARANLPWLLAEIRDREHSPSAAALAAFLEREKPDLLLEAQSKDDTTAKIIRRLRTLPRTRRISLSIAYASMVMADETRSNVEFNSLFGMVA